MAAILAAGEGAALAGMCAAVLLGITKQRPAEIEIIAPTGRRPRGGFRLRTCRNLSSRDIVVVDRIPVTTVARALVDLTDDKDADDLALLIHEAAYRNKFNLAATRAAIERANGRQNLDVLEAALRLHLSGSAGTRSRLEKRFRKLVVGAGYPATAPERDGQRLRGRHLLARPLRRDRRPRPSSGRPLRSTTGSATPRCAPPATPSCASPRTSSTCGRSGC